jgi:hypothetical protein
MEQVKEFLLTHPDAEDARLFIELLARGRSPGVAAIELDDAGGGIAALGASGRIIWWHYEGRHRDTLVIDGIEF